MGNISSRAELKPTSQYSGTGDIAITLSELHDAIMLPTLIMCLLSSKVGADYYLDKHSPVPQYG